MNLSSYTLSNVTNMYVKWPIFSFMILFSSNLVSLKHNEELPVQIPKYNKYIIICIKGKIRFYYKNKLM